MSPQKISFIHIDINSADAEIGALEKLFDRVTPGGTIIFDDYGWLGYPEQKIAKDKYFATRCYQILEPPVRGC